jgi:hypothetical protein
MSAAFCCHRIASHSCCRHRRSAVPPSIAHLPSDPRSEARRNTRWHPWSTMPSLSDPASMRWRASHCIRTRPGQSNPHDRMREVDSSPQSSVISRLVIRTPSKGELHPDREDGPRHRPSTADIRNRKAAFHWPTDSGRPRRPAPQGTPIWGVKVPRQCRRRTTIGAREQLPRQIRPLGALLGLTTLALPSQGPCSIGV